MVAGWGEAERRGRPGGAQESPLWASSRSVFLWKWVGKGSTEGARTHCKCLAAAFAAASSFALSALVFLGVE